MIYEVISCALNFPRDFYLISLRLVAIVHKINAPIRYADMTRTLTVKSGCV